MYSIIWFWLWKQYFQSQMQLKQNKWQSWTVRFGSHQDVPSLWALSRGNYRIYMLSWLQFIMTRDIGGGVSLKTLGKNSNHLPLWHEFPLIKYIKGSHKNLNRMLVFQRKMRKCGIIVLPKLLCFVAAEKQVYLILTKATMWPTLTDFINIKRCYL